MKTDSSNMGISPEKSVAFPGPFSHPSKFQTQVPRVLNLNQPYDIALDQEEQREYNIVPPVPAPPASPACGGMTSIPSHARDANAVASEDVHIRESYIADQWQESTQLPERRDVAAAATVEEVRSLEGNNKEGMAKTYTREKIVNIFRRFLNEIEGQDLDDVLKEKRRRLEEICEDFDRMIESGGDHQLGIEKRGILCIEFRGNDRNRKPDFYLKRDFLTLPNWEDDNHRVDKSFSFDMRSYRGLKEKLKEEFRRRPDSSEIQAPEENARAQNPQIIKGNDACRATYSKLDERSHQSKSEENSAGDRVQGSEMFHIQAQYQDASAVHGTPKITSTMPYSPTVRVYPTAPEYYNRNEKQEVQEYSPTSPEYSNRNEKQEVQDFGQSAEADHVQHLFPLPASDGNDSEIEGSHKRKNENSSALYIDLTVKRPKSNNRIDADNKAEQKAQIVAEQANEASSSQNHRYELLKIAEEEVAALKAKQQNIDEELKQDRQFLIILEDRINHWYDPSVLDVDVRREIGFILRSCTLRKIEQNEALFSCVKKQITGLEAISEHIRICSEIASTPYTASKRGWNLL